VRCEEKLVKSSQARYQPISIITVIVLIFAGGQQVWAQGSGLSLIEPVNIAVALDGMLMVVDESNARRSVVRINPITGDRTMVSNASTGEGVALEKPAGIAVENRQALLVADRGLSAVVRVDSITGNRTVLSGCSQTPAPCPLSLVGRGPAFDSPVDIKVAPDSTTVVADETLAALIQVDPLTGNRTMVSGAGVGVGPALMAPNRVALDGTGGWFLTDVGLHAVFHVDPITGLRTIVSDATTGMGPAFRAPAGIDVAPDGFLLVADAALGALIRVDPVTGDRTVVSDAALGSGPVFLFPVATTLASDGSALVVDQSYQSVFRVDVATGDRTVASRAATLTISPSTGRYVTGQAFDLALIAIGTGDIAMNITATLNGNDVMSILTPCLSQVPLPGGGVELRCPNASALLGLTPGRQVLHVELNLVDRANALTSLPLADEAVWEILAAP
jgi:streptogramin lyase